MWTCFILTMRNVNKVLNWTIPWLLMCFILTMRNVNFSESIETLLAVNVLY